MPDRAQIAETAAAFAQLLDGTTTHMLAVGAYRRGFPRMERLDLLVVSEPGVAPELAGGKPVAAVLQRMQQARKAGVLRQGGLSGPKLQQVVHDPTQTLVWVYLVEPGQWGWHLVLRTGPRDFTDEVLAGLGRQGYRAVKGRLEDRRGTRWDGATEQEIITLALGEWVAPEVRR